MDTAKRMTLRCWKDGVAASWRLSCALVGGKKLYQGHFRGAIHANGGQAPVVFCADACGNIEPRISDSPKTACPCPRDVAEGHEWSPEREPDLTAMGMACQAKVDGQIIEFEHEVRTMPHDDTKGVGRLCKPAVNAAPCPGTCGRGAQGEAIKPEVESVNLDDGLIVVQIRDATGFLRGRLVKRADGIPLDHVHAEGWFQAPKEFGKFWKFRGIGGGCNGLEQISGMDDKIGVQRTNFLEDTGFVVAYRRRLDVCEVEQGERAAYLITGEGYVSDSQCVGFDVCGIDAHSNKKYRDQQP